jgi:hypothetical protein
MSRPASIILRLAIALIGWLAYDWLALARVVSSEALQYSFRSVGLFFCGTSLPIAIIRTAFD